ncbi:hypothetical protein [Erythrobacter aureus]|uniref:hypothetical protein n=1 Tax=Erythrobacter aureus TaxID=2182384 RepID=UPI003A8E83B3
MFEVVGKVAGIAGISALVFLLIARRILALQIFPMLDRQRAFQILRYLIFGALFVVFLGALSWLMSLVLDREGALIENLQIGDQEVAQRIETDCTVVVTKGQVENITQSIQEIDCKKNRIRITYWRLGPEAYANLIQGYTTPRLEKLFGSTPIVVSNTPASIAVDGLFRKFGHARPDVDFSYYDGAAPDSEVYLPTTMVTESDDLPRTDTPKYEVIQGREISKYDGGGDAKRIGRIQPIIYPDIIALDTITETSQWPEDYEMFFSGFGDGRDFYNESQGQAQLIEQTVLWKDFSQQERNLIDELYALAASRTSYRSEQLRAPAVVSQLGTDAASEALYRENLSDEEFEKRQFRSRLDFFDFLARDGIPSDFMHVYGWAETNMHAGLVTWNFVAPMRQPFVLVAAIEILGEQGDFAEISGLHFLREGKESLRRTNTARRAELIEHKLSWPDYTIGSGEKIVVPLRLEFRYSREVGNEFSTKAFKRDPSVESSMQNLLARLDRNQIIEWDYSRSSQTQDPGLCCDKDRSPIKKQVSSFKQPRAPEIVDSFTYGGALIPDFLMVDGSRVELREFDPKNVFMMSIFEGGSCPILFAKFAADEPEQRIRPMIKRAIGQKNAETDEIELKGASEIILREMELETTYINRLEVTSVAGRVIAEVEDVVLRPGEELRFSVPKDNQEEGVKVRLKGYYVPL